MKYYTILLVSLLVLWSGCDIFKTTQVSKPRSYTETKGNLLPYYKVESKPWYRSMGCSTYSCSYSVWVWIKLYNPTQNSTQASVTCTFTLDGDYGSGTAKREGVVVPPRKMVRVDVSHIFSGGEERPIPSGVDCRAVFN